MKQIDFIGAPEQAPSEFKDIRNTLPVLADEKAVLLLTLGEQLKRIPASVKSGSVQTVREWRAAHAEALKVAKNSRSSS